MERKVGLALNGHLERQRCQVFVNASLINQGNRFISAKKFLCISGFDVDLERRSNAKSKQVSNAKNVNKIK